MPSIMKRMFLYIAMKMAGLSWKKPKPESSASNQPAAWYHHCGHCPLDRFKTCLFGGDLSALTISGNPAIEDLAEAWGNIYSEYLDLNNDNETIYLLQLQKEISLLTDLKIEVESALYFLSLALLPGMQFIFREELVDILRAREFDYPFYLNNPDEYSQSLEAVTNQLSPYRLRLEMHTKEYQDYIASKSNETVDTNYFDRMLTRMARFRRVMVIRAAEITVKEFVMMIQDYLEYIKSKQKTLEPDGDEG
jgi:hypothetical protein